MRCSTYRQKAEMIVLRMTLRYISSEYLDTTKCFPGLFQSVRKISYTSSNTLKAPLKNLDGPTVPGRSYGCFVYRHAYYIACCSNHVLLVTPSSFLLIKELAVVGTDKNFTSILHFKWHVVLDCLFRVISLL